MCTCGIAPVQSYLLRPDTGCAGLIYLMDWIEGLEEKAGSPPQVSLSVHLQRTQKGFGLQIGYSAELRQLVVEGVYDFVQSSEGWPVCKGDILKAVDKHDLAPNNNGQWLIDNVVKTFQNIQEKTRVSFLRPVTNEHARVLRAIRRSLARLFHLERDVTRWYPQLGVLYIRSLLERLNTAFIAMYTRPCGTVAAKASNDPSRDDARAVEAARLRGWVRVSALLDVEVANLERGMYGTIPRQCFTCADRVVHAVCNARWWLWSWSCLVCSQGGGSFSARHSCCAATVSGRLWELRCGVLLTPCASRRGR